MDDSKIRQFIALAGQQIAKELINGTPSQRELGAQLLLSETLEYVIKGLGVTPSFDGNQITDANALKYKCHADTPNKLEMIDGLADVAYTMFWNSVTFGIPLDKAFDMVCDNNLEKFVKVDSKFADLGELAPDLWHCNQSVTWPKEVEKVFIIQYQNSMFAVGKDATGKVRKPSSYKSVDLSTLISTGL
jgi:hypothetical protein